LKSQEIEKFLDFLFWRSILMVQENQIFKWNLTKYCSGNYIWQGFRKFFNAASRCARTLAHTHQDATYISYIPHQTSSLKNYLPAVPKFCIF
jgi:hypothetical protein